VSVGLPQPIGVYPKIPSTVIAPAVESALPSSVSPVFKLMAALFAIIVPRIVVPEAISTNPSIFQKTLQASAPLINFTLEDAFVDNGPEIRNIKTALGFPCAFKIKSKFKVAALEIE
jgi:hypothetical protein